MEKINVAELLKDCPTGMELDCSLFEKPVKYMEVTKSGIYVISIKTSGGEKFCLTKEGYLYDMADSQCIIFPKGKTTWEGFQRPFKDGDIVALESSLGVQVFIFKEYINAKNNHALCYVMLDICGTINIEYRDYCVGRFATEEEKQMLFKAIENNGYKWNDKTKVLEKLNEPKFKVGDRIKTNFDTFQYDITELTDTHYTLVEVEDKFKYTEPISEEKNWELVPKKFDINTLKPFDEVLVRNSDKGYWDIAFYKRYDETYKPYPYHGLGGVTYKQCIPYKGNEHLFDKNDKCDNFYNTWEE